MGVEGVAAAHFLVKEGASVTLLEAKTEAEADKTLYAALRKMGVSDFIFGENYLRNLSQFDILVRSPGVRRNQRLLDEAAANGVKITSPTQLFFEACPCKIIGVTGTKGKGTTSTLIYEMLKQAGKDAYLGGNIGLPPLVFLDQLTPESLVVLELSSFQLQDLHSSPHIGVMLMVTSEHLDYHRDLAEYIDAKRNILRFQSEKDFAVLNRDYVASNESDIYTKAHIYQVSLERECEEGCFIKGGKVVLRIKNDESRIMNQEIIDVKDILLPGKHNLENVCAAVMAAALAGVSKDIIATVLRTFKGLEHRLELVGEIKGVKYYDDSFSTTPETAIAAIKSFTKPEILILGGSSKGSDFTQLGLTIARASNIKAIIGIGAEWSRIKSEIRNPKSEIPLIEGAMDMETIVRAAIKIAAPGDVVLLTPACASFDMFKNYKERGELFKEQVKRLA